MVNAGRGQFALHGHANWSPLSSPVASEIWDPEGRPLAADKLSGGERQSVSCVGLDTDPTFADANVAPGQGVAYDRCHPLRMIGVTMDTEMCPQY